ncbi:MAG: hypothetical protein JNJ64_00960 [Flavobacteriales bacterium]|nr:hypothetical protein [Flavobacteriales bacterium]
MERILLISYFILPLLVYWKWRNLYYTRLAISARYDLFRLRDQLRLSAIEGKIDPNHEMFDFLEFMINNTIQTIERFNVFTYTFEILLRRRNSELTPEQEDSRNRLFTAIAENPVASNISSQCALVIRSYFTRKHYYLAFFGVIGWVIKSLRVWCQSQLDAIVDVFVKPRGMKISQVELARDHGAYFC